MAAGDRVAGGDLPGLQAERTLLSWDRTTLGVIANGGLVLLPQAGPQHPVRLVVAGVAVLLGVLVVLARHRRGTELRSRPGACLRPATRQVYLLGSGAAVLGLAILGFVLV